MQIHAKKCEPYISRLAKKTQKTMLPYLTGNGSYNQWKL